MFLFHSQDEEPVNSHEPPVKSVSSRDFKHGRRRRRHRQQRNKRSSAAAAAAAAAALPPPTATVLSLMEMGFPRKSVEQAVKAMPTISPSPESIVGWLLEHGVIDVDEVSTQKLFNFLTSTKKRQ